MFFNSFNCSISFILKLESNLLFVSSITENLLSFSGINKESKLFEAT